MPLKKGSSQKTISKNISKLVHEKPGKARAKAISTIAKKEGITPTKAKAKQAVAIALSTTKKKPTYSLGKAGMSGYEIIKNGKKTGEYTMTKDKASFLKLKNKK